MPTVAFSVIGHTSFPLDMLRYDACWPDSPDSVFKISTHLHHTKDEAVQIDLIGNRTPTAARWASFGWYVK